MSSAGRRRPPSSSCPSLALTKKGEPSEISSLLRRSGSGVAQAGPSSSAQQQMYPQHPAPCPRESPDLQGRVPAVLPLPRVAGTPGIPRARSKGTKQGTKEPASQGGSRERAARPL